MTSDPLSSSDAPEQPAPTESTSAAEDALAAEDKSPDAGAEPATESSPTPRMKIGSQREGHRPEIHRPRVTPPPEAGLTGRKQLHLERLAARLRTRREYRGLPVRIDAIAIVWPEGGKPELRHYQDAFSR